VTNKRDVIHMQGRKKEREKISPSIHNIERWISVGNQEKPELLIFIFFPP
jgi:hypothetical protein